MDINKVLESHKKWLSGECGERANLLGAPLRRVDLRGADLRGAILSRADLFVANLLGANLSRVDLRGADLRDANLLGADLRGATLRGANLSGANLSGANLSRADLSGANLLGADLSRANLSDANLKVYQSGIWTAYVQPDHIRIGCQYFRVEEWEAFSDERISEMHPLALDYWKENKHIVLSIAQSLDKGTNVWPGI